MKRKNVKKSVKLNFNTSTLRSRVLPILKQIAAGNYPAKVARILGLSRSHVHYYLKRMEKAGLIKREGPRWPVFYTVTPQCSKFLDGIERGLVPGPVVRLHNCVFRYPILVQPSVDLDWRRVQLTNWSQFLGREGGLTVRKNTGSLEVFCDVMEGRDPNELLILAKEEADRVAKALEARLGMRLGEGKPSRKAHFGIYDPVAALVSKHWELSDDVGKIDESEGHGELDWFSSEAAKDYLLMPGYVRKLLEIQRTFAVAMEQHMALIQELREVAKTLKAAIENIHPGLSG